MRQLLTEAVAYAAVSAVAFGVDFAILYLLVETAGWHYLLAATCSFLTGAVVAYVLSTRLVFRFRRLSDRRLEFTVFAGIGVIGVVINGIVMYVVVEAFGVQYLIAKVAAASLTFGTNFLLRRWALFSPRPVATPPNQGMRKELT